MVWRSIALTHDSSSWVPDAICTVLMIFIYLLCFTLAKARPPWLIWKAFTFTVLSGEFAQHCPRKAGKQDTDQVRNSGTLGEQTLLKQRHRWKGHGFSHRALRQLYLPFIREYACVSLPSSCFNFCIHCLPYLPAPLLCQETRLCEELI